MVISYRVLEIEWAHLMSFNGIYDFTAEVILVILKILNSLSNSYVRISMLILVSFIIVNLWGMKYVKL